MMHINSHLIICIELGENTVAKSLLESDYEDIKDSLGYLLHHAVSCVNLTIVEYLLELGCDVDLLDSNSRTPMMIAVERGSPSIVRMLLDANANLDVRNTYGESVLSIIFSSVLICANTKILILILERLRRDYPNAEDLAGKLIEAGCTMFEAVFTRDVTLMQSLADSGINIDSRDDFGRTPLHVVVDLNDVNVAKWLLDNGADINALDGDGKVPLFFATIRGNVDLVRVFLEGGADPNIADQQYDRTPLFVAMTSSMGEDDQQKFDECIELLLQYGAIPRNSSIEHCTLFDYGLFINSSDRMNLLIGHLAMLSKLGKLNDAESVIQVTNEAHLQAQRQLKHNYDKCCQFLDYKLYQNSTTFDLLTVSDDKMKIFVRNETFISNVKSIDCRLRGLYSFYFKPLMTRISKAVDEVKLENAAISALCALFGNNYNQWYYFARQVIGYLNKDDLKQLSNVLD